MIAGLAVVAGAAAAVILISGGKPRAVTPPRAIAFGANTGRLFNDGRYSPTVIAAQLAALHATGVSLVRSDAFWEATEPSPPQQGVHHYNWGFDDLIAAALAAHGLRWLPIIDYSAPWARTVPGQEHSPPTSAADYSAYASALASRYGPGGAFWRLHPELQPRPTDIYEIWNEPDSTAFWFPKPDAADYVALYLGARRAIKAAQPGSRVIVGGLTRLATFIPQMIAAAPALARQLDGVAIHPYGRTPAAVIGKVRSARATLDAAGLTRVPLYVTEFGWSTRPPGGFGYLPERLRPAYIEQTLTELGHLDCGVAAVLLYAWITPQRNPSDSNDWFGINPPAGGGSPDVRALVKGLHAARAPAAQIPC
jgi:hypothetical protein